VGLRWEDAVGATGVNCWQSGMSCRLGSSRCVCSINVLYAYPAKLTTEDDKEITVWCPACGVAYTYRYLGSCRQYKFWAGSLTAHRNCPPSALVVVCILYHVAVLELTVCNAQSHICSDSRTVLSRCSWLLGTDKTVTNIGTYSQYLVSRTHERPAI